jgi:hypothetical protein
MLEVVTVIRQTHDYRCLIYDSGPCDCGLEKLQNGVTLEMLQQVITDLSRPNMIDEEINEELFDKEMAKD